MRLVYAKIAAVSEKPGKQPKPVHQEDVCKLRLRVEGADMCFSLIRQAQDAGRHLWHMPLSDSCRDGRKSGMVNCSYHRLHAAPPDAEHSFAPKILPCIESSDRTFHRRSQAA